MLNRISSSDGKLEGLLEGTGHHIYLTCDNDGQWVLQQVEAEGLLELNGSYSDPTKEMLVNSILDLIAKTRSVKNSDQSRILWKGFTAENESTVKAFQVSFFYLKDALLVSP